jgi:predicted nucleotidyltransferase
LSEVTNGTDEQEVDTTPTALELYPQGLKPYIEGLRRRVAAPPPEKRGKAALLRRVRRAAALLRSRFGAQRVVLFGSLAHAAWYSPESDVDLAVEGIAGADFWKAWAEVERVIGGRRIDLVDLATASDSLHQAIARHGIEL